MAELTLVRVSSAVSVQLGIRRISVPIKHYSNLGEPLLRAGDSHSISLSGGDDGPIFAWWKVECRPSTGRCQCRSPDGCKRKRLDGHSYCAACLARYRAPKLRSSGQPILLSAALNRRRKKQSPRPDLVGE